MALTINGVSTANNVVTDHWIKGVKTFQDNESDVYIDLGQAFNIGRAMLRYYMTNGTTTENGTLNIGCDGQNAAIDQVRQPIVGDDVIETVEFLAEIDNDNLKLSFINSGNGDEITFRYAYHIPITI